MNMSGQRHNRRQVRLQNGMLFQYLKPALTFGMHRAVKASLLGWSGWPLLQPLLQPLMGVYYIMMCSDLKLVIASMLAECLLLQAWSACFAGSKLWN